MGVVVTMVMGLKVMVMDAVVMFRYVVVTVMGVVVSVMIMSRRRSGHVPGGHRPKRVPCNVDAES